MQDIASICVRVEGLQIGEGQDGEGWQQRPWLIIADEAVILGEREGGREGCVQSGRCGDRSCALLFLTFSLSSSRCQSYVTT